MLGSDCGTGTVVRAAASAVRIRSSAILIYSQLTVLKRRKYRKRGKECHINIIFFYVDVPTIREQSLLIEASFGEHTSHLLYASVRCTKILNSL